MKLALGEFTWDEPAARLHPSTLPPFHPSTLIPSSRHPVIPSSPRPLIPAPPVRQPDGQRGADALLVSSSDVHDGPACRWLLAAVTATAFVVRAVAARVCPCPCPCPCLPGMAARWSAVIPPGPRSPSPNSFFLLRAPDRQTNGAVHAVDTRISDVYVYPLVVARPNRASLRFSCRRRASEFLAS